MKRVDAVGAAIEVHNAVLRAAEARSSSAHATTWVQGELARVTVLRPIDYRDEGDAVALAMDAGADRDQLAIEHDIVRGWVVVEDDVRPVVVQLHVLYGSQLDHLRQDAATVTPAAGIPVQRYGEVETIRDLDAAEACR